MKTSSKLVILILFCSFFSLIGGINSALAAGEIRDIFFPTEKNVTFTDSFGDARSGGRAHEGTDMMGSKMMPLYSAIDGVVVDLEIPEASWGYAIGLKDADGYIYNYLHVNNDTPGTDDDQGGVDHAYAPFIYRGAPVRKGQLIGWMGDSGNAEAVGAHLHFEIRRPDKTAIDPYYSLIAARDGAAAVPATAVVKVATPKYVFKKDLKFGMNNSDVKELQKFLNANGFTVAKSGAGSPGKETNYFGPATRTALIKYQKAKKISPAVGYFGPITRAAFNK